MGNKKLCLVIPSLNEGGMQRVMSELAGYFCRINELEVHLVLFGKGHEIFYSLPGNVFIYKPLNEFNDKFRFLCTIDRLFYLRRIVKRINPDSILSFGEYWNSFVLLSLIGLDYPVFISDRCSPETKFSFLHYYLRKWLYPKAHGVIIQTEKAKQVYSRKVKTKKICVIGNPIRVINSNKILEKQNIVLSIGRLIETKHFDNLIEIFTKTAFQDWKLMIVGGDALKQKNMEKLKRQIEQCGMNDRIILTGTQQDVDHYYLTSKIFAFTSSSEGFPNVIGEAMSAGMPVISFDCVAGPSEMIIDNENGFLIPLFDYQSFEKRLKLLMHNELLRNKIGNAAKEAIKTFNIDSIGQKYYSFLFNQMQ